jgi:hypothetical protein
MPTRNTLGRFPLAAILPVAFAALASSAAAGPVDLDLNAPTLDRRMYPFGSTPGAETQISVFGALGLEGFDDRDAQMLVGFDTAPVIPTGEGFESYRLVRAELVLTTLRDMTFAHDPTHDVLETYFDPADPRYIADEDAGRPVELFCVGYRGGFGPLSYTETSPFGGEPTVPPAEGARFAFAAAIDSEGDATDLSNNVAERIAAQPLAVGEAVGVAPGELVPAETEIVLRIDPCAPGARRHFGAAFDIGRLNLIVSSLHPADVGVTEVPTFFSKEHPLGGDPFFRAARLRLTVMIGDDADINGDGAVDFFDFLEFQSLFAAGDPAADYTADCRLDFFDFLAFQEAFAR